jgi:2-keto-4-pentenoate hydratase
MRAAAAALALIAAAAPAQAACPDMAEVARFARALLERRVPQPWAQGTDPACAQQRLVGMLAQPWGDIEGIVLAADTAPPLRGALFHANFRARSGATIESAYAARPAVAPALLLTIGREGAEGAADPLAHVATVAPFLLLLDLAAMPAGMDAASRRAGNLGVRLGVAGAALPLRDPSTLAATALLQADHGTLASLPGLGLATPPGPLLAALARDLAAEGRPLRAGEQVALMGPAAPIAPRAGETWRLSVEGLGAAIVNFR